MIWHSAGMQLSASTWKIIRSTMAITAASLALSFLPVWLWLQIDPVILKSDIYISTVVLPLLIAPACSIGVLRAHMKAKDLAALNYQLANHDELTGLPNRRAFFAQAAALQAGAVPGQTVFACAIADIDNFKRINDTLGHEAGDLVLKDVAAAMGAAAPDGVTVARLGGEEFAIAGRFAGEPAARLWFEALVRTVAARCHAGDQALTVSLGWCTEQPGETLSAHLSRADGALYAAKARGKNRAVRAVEDGAPQMTAVA